MTLARGTKGANEKEARLRARPGKQAPVSLTILVGHPTLSFRFLFIPRANYSLKKEVVDAVSTRTSARTSSDSDLGFLRN